MQDYREIDRIRKDVVAVRSLAKRLLDLPHADWNDWELDFLQHMVRFDPRILPHPFGSDADIRTTTLAHRTVARDVTRTILSSTLSGSMRSRD
jgi:hypothetical protein